MKIQWFTVFVGLALVGCATPPPPLPPPVVVPEPAVEPASAPEPDMAHERFDAESMELPEATLLSGVVASFEGGRLVIEVTPTDTADWLLLGSAELRLRDGTRVTLSVDQARSTASGVYPAGTTLRLVVDGAPEPAATELLSVHVMPTDRPGLRIDIA